MIDRARYPALFVEQTARWPTATVRYVFEDRIPEPDEISNVRMVAFAGERVVVIRMLDYGDSAFPGGTLDDGETYRDALARELREEAGARLVSFTPFGGVRFHSDAPEPYRPHLPHPEFRWIVGYGDVVLDGAPTNPPDGEHVLEVGLFAPADVPDQGDWWRDLLRLAVDLRARA